MMTVRANKQLESLQSGRQAVMHNVHANKFLAIQWFMKIVAQKEFGPVEKFLETLQFSLQAAMVIVPAEKPLVSLQFIR